MSKYIRFAESDADRDRVFRQRFEVYHREMGLYPEDADADSGILKDGDDEDSHLMLAEKEGEVVGSLRLHVGGNGGFPESFHEPFSLGRLQDHVPLEKVLILSRFTILKQYRKSRIPFMMIRKAHEFSLENRLQIALLDCVPHLINLYLSLGFRHYSKPIQDPDVGFLVPMALVLTDHEYLEAIQSPLRKTPRPEGAPVSSMVDCQSLFPDHQSTRSQGFAKDESYWSHAFEYLNDVGEKPRIFDGMAEADKQQLLSDSHILRFENGDDIIKRGTSGESLFIILRGAAGIYIDNVMINAIQEGELFGEMAFLMNAERTADVRVASDDCEFMVLDPTRLNRLMKNDGALASRLMLNLSRIVCERLTRLSDVVSGHASHGEDD